MQTKILDQKNHHRESSSDLSPIISLFFVIFIFRYRFVELYYRRVETVRKGRTVPARTQTVVIFLPDVRSCLPTRVEWDELCIKYKKHLEMKKQSNDGEEIADVDKKFSISKSSDAKTNEGSSNVDVEMADESKKLDTESYTVGDTECLEKAAESTETKATTESETTSTAAISKALLNNIISNITLDSFCSVLVIIHIHFILHAPANAIEIFTSHTPPIHKWFQWNTLILVHSFSN